MALSFDHCHKFSVPKKGPDGQYTPRAMCQPENPDTVGRRFSDVATDCPACQEAEKTQDRRDLEAYQHQCLQAVVAARKLLLQARNEAGDAHVPENNEVMALIAAADAVLAALIPAAEPIRPYMSPWMQHGRRM